MNRKKESLIIFKLIERYDWDKRRSESNATQKTMSFILNQSQQVSFAFLSGLFTRVSLSIVMLVRNCYYIVCLFPREFLQKRHFKCATINQHGVILGICRNNFCVCLEQWMITQLIVKSFLCVCVYNKERI